MHDLHLVGVHEDGEHLLLRDAAGGRFSLPIDEALRAAARRDRAHLGQLQIEIEGGMRPRDIQARIRAGACAEEVATLAGWTVEKVQRYQGPVLAEREHVAALARTVRVRQRGAEPVALGPLVGRRLSGRGVDPERVTWDAVRPDSGPWTVIVTFAAGGRERQARWHLDVAAMSVAAADDEARWLSEDESSQRGLLSAVRDGEIGRETGIGSGARAVYDIEADGGVGAEPRRETPGGPLDLVSAMRSRRRSGGAQPRRHGSSARQPGGPAPTASDQPSDVPGTTTHPAGRRRVRPEPLELNPTLMDDPPAAHPPASEVEHLAERPAPGRWPLAHAMRPTSSDKADANTDADPSDVPPKAPDVPPEPGGRSQPPGRRGRRSSVPTWDDIVFGKKD